MRSLELAPSILAADFSRLGEHLKEVEDLCGRIHVDVMDGHFVPNLSMGPQVVESLRPVTGLPIEVHLMVEKPENFAEPFIKAGANRIVFHQEVVERPANLAERIQSLGASAGVAINPKTELSADSSLLALIDLIVVMTVNPGFGGQAFLLEVMPKLDSIRKMVEEINPTLDLEVDGGIDKQTAPTAVHAGANVLVAGNAIFKSSDPRTAAREILGSVARQP
ncbi:MAG TPA: ribulose-phosphate 3-epimerase [Actinomycetota bacterium]|nr:ribulose-phosphate 3-epimerase [Actinomycetota bacterium]